MIKKYNVKYSELFYKDLNSILIYIKCELENPKAAINLFDEVMKAIINRSVSPSSYQKLYSNRKRKQLYYKISVKNYTVFYVLNNSEMEVRRILYSRRNFDKLI